MSHEMQPDMQLEMAVEQAQQDIVEIRKDLEDLHKFVTGNGDPKQGLLWAVADLGRMNASLGTLIDAQRQALEKRDDTVAAALAAHIGDASKHIAEQRKSNVWTRLAYDVGKNVAVWAVIGILGLVVLGMRVSIGGGILQP